jgi:hypothetical protein
MESERRVKKGGKWMWERVGKRPNHYWDAECLQAVAATMLKLIGRESVSAEPVKEGAAVDAAESA